MHTAVLLQEVLKNLNIKRGGLYIDATFGEGGHTLAILKKGGKVLAIDLDRQQISNFQFLISKQIPIPNIKNLVLKEGNFREIEKIAKENDFYPVDGILFDLGLSMWQLESGGRGFSFKRLGEPLDMRISGKLKIKASDLVNSLTQNQLYDLLATYSEELNSLCISQAIVSTRSLKRIQTVGDLVAIIDGAIGRKDEKVYRRIFQALRIAVNGELENLEKGLLGALHLIRKDGRIAVITFHSLEDRIVKRFVREHKLTLLTKKPIVSERDLSFERSAKLRVISVS